MPQSYCWPSWRVVMIARMRKRILYNMNPRQLVDVACKAYHQKLVGGEKAASPKEVGHNIYIFAINWRNTIKNWLR